MDTWTNAWMMGKGNWDLGTLTPACDIQCGIQLARIRVVQPMITCCRDHGRSGCRQSLCD